jgi:hypothetical protein
VVAGAVVAVIAPVAAPVVVAALPSGAGAAVLLVRAARAAGEVWLPAVAVLAAAVPGGAPG